MSMSSDIKVVKFKEIGAMRDKMGYKPSPIFNNCVASNFTTLEERIDMALGLLGFTIDQERMINLPLTVVGADELNRTAKKFNLMTWPLYEATMNQADRSGMLKALLARGADPNKTFGNTAFGLNRPVFHWLALRPNYMSPTDDVEVVKLLVGAGAKIDFVDGTGYTSLILAAKTGNVNFVKALLKHAPDLNILQKDVEHEYFSSYLGGGMTVKKTWRTARDWATEMKQTEIFNLIKAAGGKGAKEVKS